MLEGMWDSLEGAEAHVFALKNKLMSCRNGVRASHAYDAEVVARTRAVQEAWRREWKREEVGPEIHIKKRGFSHFP
jgi:hypothetical protein